MGARGKQFRRLKISGMFWSNKRGPQPSFGSKVLNLPHNERSKLLKPSRREPSERLNLPAVLVPREQSPRFGRRKRRAVLGCLRKN